MHTSIGRVREHLLNGLLNDELDQDMDNVNRAREIMLGLIDDVPHYVISEKLVELVSDDWKNRKLMKSVKAMVVAGVAKLPFDPILLEFRFDAICAFVRLQSKPWSETRLTGNFDYYAYPMLTKPDPRPSNTGGILMACLDAGDTAMPIKLETGDDHEQPFTVYGQAPKAGNETLNDDISVAAVLAISLAMLMLNTRGVIAEKVDTSKINKARAKSGKNMPPISDYTVVRVGHVYDAAGKAHDVGGSGRHMPVHWRAGHIRNVRYGPAGARQLGEGHIDKEMRPTRPFWIEPCLVNFVPGDEVPLPKKEVML